MKKIFVHGCEVLLYGDNNVRINAPNQETSDKIFEYLIEEGIIKHHEY